MSMTKIPTLGMRREDWLEERRKSIGGSDAAGILGLNRYSSPFTLWLDKTGQLPEKEETEAMRIGRDLEDYVAKRWSEATGKKVRRENHLIRNSLYPFAHADVDRMVVGENAGLECKTTSTLDLRQFHGVEFPEKYYAQCVHYLAVTGAERWYLAVLVFGRGFFCYTLERDQAEIDALMAAEADFWRLVENGTPPAPGGTAPDTEALSVIYAESRPETVELFGRGEMLEDYFRLKAQKKALDEQLDCIENTLKQDMGEAETGFCGDFRISWKAQSRSTFQAKDFQRANPGMDLEPFYKVSTARPFKITREDA